MLLTAPTAYAALPEEATAQAEKMITVSGVVFDAATRAPLPGVRVVAHGNQKYSTMTDESGSYTLKVPTFVTLLDLQAPGYNLIQMAVGEKSQTVNLYSEQFSRDYSAEVNVSDLAQTEDFSISTALTVDQEIGTRLGGDLRSITRSGTPAMGSAMFIGGLNSLNANAQPLVVVDGVFVDQQYSRDALHEGHYNNVLSGINVNDIEKITVLKNATALYGTKGSNGVIIIDTKRSTSMATRIEANVMAGIELLPNRPSMMNASQYRLYASELIGSTGTELTDYKFLNNDLNYYYYKQYHNDTNWDDYVYREAFTQNYNMSVQGGDEVADYNLSLGYTNAESMLDYNNFSRMNLRFNTDIKLIGNLSTRFDVAYNYNTRNLRDDGIIEDFTKETILSPNFLALIKAPFLHPYRHDDNGELTSFVSQADDFASDFGLNTSWANPVAINKYGDAKNKNRLEYSVFNISIAPRYDFSSNLYATTLFYYALSNNNQRAFVPMTGTPTFYIDGVGESTNSASALNAKQESLFSDTKVDWTYRQRAHYLNLIGGFRFTNDNFVSTAQEGHNTGNDKTPNVSGSLNYSNVGGIDDTWRSFAYYANADYNYKYKYFVQGGLSMETTSRFGKDVDAGVKLAGVHWGLFPSLQAAWLVSSEDFFSVENTCINSLKLSAGYDASGNDDIAVSASRTSLSANRFLNGSIGLVLDNIGNTGIQWETTHRFRAGLDLVMLNNRMDLSFNLFKSYTNNLLTVKSLPEITGSGYYWSNDGSLENVGGDLGLRYKLLNNKEWKWEAGAHIAAYKNKITALPDGDYTTSIYGANVLTSVGRAAGVFYGYETAGVYATQQEAEAEGLKLVATTGEVTPFGAGDMRFVDHYADNVINEKDMVVIGDPNPDFYGNLFSNLSYKRLTLNMNFSYSYGNDIYNYQRSLLEGGSQFFNQTTALNRRWIAEGQQTDVPKATFGDPMGNSRFSDRWIEDGSYLRLRSVTLSYALPVTSVWLQGVTVWATANNLFTLTNYLGSDPEVWAGNSVLYQGIDRGLTAQGRSVLMGIKINL
ncbi:MAG: SusC/RagA family TonB-linked outer membrane protein [Bacteroidaceae bacterium]|nr:SusC/RagA family TonB-linked outer membrane protein [Bacteroidaceae bacterium]